MSSKSQNPDSTMGYKPHDPNQDTDFIDTSGSQSEPDITNYEPDLVQIDDPDEVLRANQKVARLQEEHIPRCRACHFSLLGTAHAKGTCPACGMLYDLERPKTYLTYSRHQSLILSSARLCGLIPLACGITIFILYVISRYDGLDKAGLINILAGNALAISGMLLLLVYLIKDKLPMKYKARRSIICLLLILANYPVCLLLIFLVTQLGYVIKT